LHKYETILNAISQFNLPILITFSAGAGVSLILFSRFFSWLLKHYHRATLFVIIGMLIGSLWVIWPFQNRVYETVHGKEILMYSSPYLPRNFDELAINTLIMGIIGLLIVLGLHKWSNTMQRSDF